jgi:hypothetical protein
MNGFVYALKNRHSDDELICVSSDDIRFSEPAEVLQALQERFVSSARLREHYCHIVIWKDGVWCLQLHDVQYGEIQGKKVYERQCTDHAHNVEHSHSSYTELLEHLVEQYWSTCDLGFYFLVRPFHPGDLLTVILDHGIGKRRRDI